MFGLDIIKAINKAVQPKHKNPPVCHIDLACAEVISTLKSEIRMLKIANSKLKSELNNDDQIILDLAQTIESLRKLLRLSQI